MVTLSQREVEPIKAAVASLLQQPVTEHIGHQIFLRQIVDLIDLGNLLLSGRRDIFIYHAGLNSMQQGITLAPSEPAAHLRPRIKPNPKRFAMLAFRILHPMRVVDLAGFYLRRETHDVAEIQDVGRQPRQHIDSILGKSLLTIKIHKVRLRAEQDRGIEQWEIWQTVADFRKALKRIYSSRFQRQQVLTEQICLSISQPLVREEIGFGAGKGPQSSRVTQLLQIACVSYIEHFRPQQQVRRDLLRMAPSD